MVWQLVDYSMNTANSLGKTELAVMHKFRFRLEAGNGEAYESEASAQNGIASVQENAAHTPSPVLEQPAAMRLDRRAQHHRRIRPGHRMYVFLPMSR